MLKFGGFLNAATRSIIGRFPSSGQLLAQGFNRSLTTICGSQYYNVTRDNRYCRLKFNYKMHLISNTRPLNTIHRSKSNHSSQSSFNTDNRSANAHLSGLHVAQMTTTPLNLGLHSSVAIIDNNESVATTVIDAVLNASQRQLRVTWYDGQVTKYPYAWLRDCCQCPDCFHSVTSARRLMFQELDFNVLPVNVEVI